MEEVTGPRPSRRPWHAFTWLDHFAIVSYLVDPARVDALLPAGLTADRFECSATPTAAVSAVSAHDRRFRFRGLPWPAVSAGQIDYRTYVRSGDQTGVWFFGASLDSTLVAVARGLWSMPWHHDQVTVAADWRGEALDGLSVRAHGWGRAELDLTGAGPEAGAVDPLAAIPAITDPLVGWYRRGDRVGRYRVWHPPLEPQPVTVAHAHYEVFERLGLIVPDQPPVSALVRRAVPLDVQTPPHRWRPRGADTDDEPRSGVGQGRRSVAVGDAGEIQRPHREHPS
jgi:uncharacterized protein YqjF (DUF2071 family)